MCPLDSQSGQAHEQSQGGTENSEENGRGQTQEEKKASVQQSSFKKPSPDLLFQQRKPSRQKLTLRTLSPSPPEGRSQALGICLCQRKNVTLTYLFPHSYCLSSFKMTSRKAIMKFTWGCGCSGRRGKAAASLPVVACGEACVRVSIKYPLPLVCELLSQLKATSHLLNDRSH